MPRKSAAALAVVPVVTGAPPRLNPPTGLSDAARLVFAELVAATDAKHFTRADLPLLTEYATACDLARQAAKELEVAGPVVAGRVSPWLTIQEKSLRAMVALSLRLRVCPQARMSAAKAGTNARNRGVCGIDAILGGRDDEA